MPNYEITSPEGKKFQITAPDGATQDQVLAYAQEQFKAQPAPTSKPLPANAGLANFGASILGTPSTIIKGLANIPIMAAGTAATAFGRPDLSREPLDVPGGPEFFANLLRKTGQPGLSPDNPTPESKMGTAQYDFTSRGGFIPGSALPAAGSMVAEKIGGPQWSVVGGLVPSAATAVFNAVRAPSLAREQAQNQVRDATLKPAQDAGYILPPSAIKPTAGINIAESFAGKTALNQESALKNQQVTNNLVRQELKLPENTPLTVDTLEQARTTAAQPYRDIAALSPVARNALEKLRDARNEANINFRHYDMTGTPQSLRDARAADAKATMLEGVLERQATMSGNPQLVQAMRDARSYIAKTWDVERALNVGNGNVDARIIGKAIDRGRPLSGNLETIGKFSKAYPTFTMEASKVGNPGSSALNGTASIILGEEGFRHFGAPGLAAAALPFVRGGLRQGMLSDVYQQNFNMPNYASAMKPQGTLEALVQQAIIANQQQAK